MTQVMRDFEVMPMKKLKWIVVVGLICGSIYLLGSYYLVRTKSGFKVVEKTKFGFASIYVDTTDWTPMDYIREPDIRGALVGDKLKDLKNTAAESWKDFSTKFEQFVKDQELDDTSRKAKKEIDLIKKATRKKFEELETSWKKKEISADAFKKKLAELKRWSEQELDKLLN